MAPWKIPSNDEFVSMLVDLVDNDVWRNDQLAGSLFAPPPAYLCKSGRSQKLDFQTDAPD